MNPYEKPPITKGACPFCKWPESELQGLENDFALRKCASCGYAFSDRATPQEIMEDRKHKRSNKVIKRSDFKP